MREIGRLRCGALRVSALSVGECGSGDREEGRGKREEGM